MAIAPPTHAILRSYRLSRYEAGHAVLHVGRLVSGLDPAWREASRRQGLVLLSACNPGGRRRPDGWNDRMMQRLAQVVQAAPRPVLHAAGHGVLGRWSEPLVMVAIDRRRGIAVARRFRQNAVILVSRDARARLSLLDSN
ncbi:DUF3293 domain-containing protein [Lichenicoccus roseus]|uniref:DUF3293 domain-containing protein n=1 Tax=Lichenicoccus roseus TaxID=2683649 RepID=A0A5R9JBD6_9PROT|nr:DUF3293 domain-containing protein [Lichenicoccus roseus]TLU72931.1 DUF3293 domain-containing protein [Lichenicoccus roseus]